MLTGELARYRIEDRVREAEAYRAAGDTRRAKHEARRARARRTVSGLLAALLWPIKH
jgi:hypothetical protein